MAALALRPLLAAMLRSLAFVALVALATAAPDATREAWGDASLMLRVAARAYDAGRVTRHCPMAGGARLGRLGKFMRTTCDGCTWHVRAVHLGATIGNQPGPGHNGGAPLPTHLPRPSARCTPHSVMP